MPEFLGFEDIMTVYFSVLRWPVLEYKIVFSMVDLQMWNELEMEIDPV